jgi:hypothetical protein
MHFRSLCLHFYSDDATISAPLSFHHQNWNWYPNLYPNRCLTPLPLPLPLPFLLEESPLPLLEESLLQESLEGLSSEELLLEVSEELLPEESLEALKVAGQPGFFVTELGFDAASRQVAFFQCTLN